jgi:hypothetical protein
VYINNRTGRETTIHATPTILVCADKVKYIADKGNFCGSNRIDACWRIFQESRAAPAVGPMAREVQL